MKPDNGRNDETSLCSWYYSPDNWTQTDKTLLVKAFYNSL